MIDSEIVICFVSQLDIAVDPLVTISQLTNRLLYFFCNADSVFYCQLSILQILPLVVFPESANKWLMSVCQISFAENLGLLYSVRTYLTNLAAHTLEKSNWIYKWKTNKRPN